MVAFLHFDFGFVLFSISRYFSIADEVAGCLQAINFKYILAYVCVCVNVPAGCPPAFKYAQTIVFSNVFAATANVTSAPTLTLTLTLSFSSQAATTLTVCVFFFPYAPVTHLFCACCCVHNHKHTRAYSLVHMYICIHKYLCVSSVHNPSYSTIYAWQYEKLIFIKMRECDYNNN